MTVLNLDFTCLLVKDCCFPSEVLEQLEEQASLFRQPVILCGEKAVLFNAVGFQQMNFKAVAQVAIEFLDVESLDAVINLIDVFCLSPKHGQEADDLQEVASLASFWATLPPPQPCCQNSAGDKESFHTLLRLAWQTKFTVRADAHGLYSGFFNKICKLASEAKFF